MIVVAPFERMCSGVACQRIVLGTVIKPRVVVLVVPFNSDDLVAQLSGKVAVKMSSKKVPTIIATEDFVVMGVSGRVFEFFYGGPPAAVSKHYVTTGAAANLSLRR